MSSRADNTVSGEDVSRHYQSAMCEAQVAWIRHVMPVYEELKRERVGAFDVAGRCFVWPDYVPSCELHIWESRYAVLAHIHEKLAEGPQDDEVDHACRCLQAHMQDLRKAAMSYGSSPWRTSGRFSPLIWDMQCIRCGAIVYDICRIMSQRGFDDIAEDINSAFGMVRDFICADPCRVAFPDIKDVLYYMSNDVSISPPARAHLKAQVDVRSMVERV